jgi:transcriptional regulator GlxA family with amidase domain
VYLNRIFKEYTHQTIHQFLINLRLNKAKELLLTTLLDITKISEEVGFLSYTHFIKVFREKFEIPPQQYRKAHKYRGY